MSRQALSTEPTGRILRRAFARATAVSLAIVAVAAGPSLARNWRALLHAMARPIHLPDLALLAQAPAAVQFHLATLAAAVGATAALLALPGRLMWRVLFG